MEGYKTTEFWMALLAIVGTLALVLVGKAPADAWLSVVGVSSGAYAISRGMVKAKQVESSVENGK